MNEMTVTIPECGHLTCAHGFMGCIYAVRKRLYGLNEDVPTLEPGTKVKLRQVADTGFPDKDWVEVSRG